MTTQNNTTIDATVTYTGPDGVRAQGTVVDVGGFDIRVRANRWWSLTPSSNAGAQRLVLVDFGVKWVAPGVFETIVGANRKQRRVQVPGQTEPGMLWVEPSTLTAAA